jgi:ribosomal protein S6--L-glutamate ligase
MKKDAIGYIYSNSYLDAEDKLLIRLLKKKVKVILLPLEKQVDLEQIKENVKKCRLILNDTIWGNHTFEGIQLTKTIESLGIRVINSSNSFIYDEDKWMMYLKLIKNKLPTPKTYLIPNGRNSKQIKEILKKNSLVLKAVYSDNGVGVEKVEAYEDFIKKVNIIRTKNPISPIIAQNYIQDTENRSYRITLIDNRVVQSVVKIGKSWKQTGSKEQIRLVKLPKEVTLICEKASKVLDMDICGIDLVNSKGKWFIIEVNSCPSLDFIKKDMPRIISKLVDFLYKEYNSIIFHKS